MAEEGTEREGGSRFEREAAAAVGATIFAGAIRYRRRDHLPRLLHLLPGDLPAGEPEATRFVLERLTEAVAQERRRARARHWAYDLNRHIALAQAIEAERRSLATRPSARPSGN